VYELTTLAKHTQFITIFIMRKHSRFRTVGLCSGW